MARSYATFDCGMWDDEAFCRLSAGAQRTYFMLVTQRTIAACGTLALTIRRWSRTCSEPDLKTWLAELVQANYVVLDEETEELLVRTFAKWDGGYRHPQRVKAVMATAAAIESRAIRTVMASELVALGLESPYRVPPESHSSGTQEGPEFGRFRLSNVTTDRNPDPEPETGGADPLDASAEPPAMFCTKHPTGTEEPCGPCGGARKRYAAWAEARTAGEIEVKRAAAAARSACDLCDDRGMRLDPSTRLPAGRCTHEPFWPALAPVSSAGLTSVRRQQ